MNSTCRTTIVCCAISLAAITQAQALNTRTWVSGAGVDQSGCGPIASPCRTLQYAHDQTSAGGEINFKDSAGYGAVVINKSINVVSDGAFAGVLAVANGDAIRINIAATDTVVLQGLTVEGANVGFKGINLASSGKVAISKCTVRNFQTGVGIASGTFDLTIEDSDISFNSGRGIDYTALGANTFERVFIRNSVFKGNNYGISLFGGSASQFTISGSAVINNRTYGISLVQGHPGTLDNVTVTGSDTGVYNYVGTFLIGRSTIIGNKIGLKVESGTTTLSYRNNQINSNTTDISGTTSTVPMQ